MSFPSVFMTKVFDLRQTDDPSDIIHRTVQALTEGQALVFVDSES